LLDYPITAHSTRRRQHVVKARRSLLSTMLLAAILAVCAAAAPSNRYTERQLSALAERVGHNFWIQAADGRAPVFLSQPDPRAPSFAAQTGESFEITGLLRGKTPYYKVRFTSGREGYLAPETMLEELNVTILTVDPLLYEKRKAAEQAEEEKKRLQWIEAQPWPAAAKEAARNGNPVPGMNANEVKKVAGAPDRVVKTDSHGTIPEERWIYANGRELVFQRGLLVRIIRDDHSGAP
jgi:hypothetical protein